AFKPDKVILEGQSLSFRKGKEFIPDMEIKFDLADKLGPKLESNELKFGGNFGDPVVWVSDKNGNNLPKMESAMGQDYTMTLRFTKRTGKTVEGVIDLKVTKPADTNLAGTFVATVKKTAIDQLAAEDSPYVRGTIACNRRWETDGRGVGFVATGAAG